LTVALRRTLDSLTVPNYRRYFTGQVVSISGNWMQTVAETWLVIKLTGSGAAVGLTAGLQFLPILLLGALGGVFVDRYDKRRLLMLTQTLMAIPALTLWALTATGSVQLWMVYVLVLIRGTVNAVDNPARQTFVMELVGPDKVVNAVSLNSVIIHTARIAGPMFAGAVIAIVGVSPCFLVNSLSFGAMLIALRRMDPAGLHTPRRAPRLPGQVRAAIREVAARPDLRVPLLMMVVIGTLSFNFQVLLPLFARFTWHGTATTYALLMAAMGVGSIAGALKAGHRGRVTPRLLVGSAALFGTAQLGAALAPSQWAQMAVLVPLGAASVTFAAGVNSSLQLAAGELRGRVMALYSVVFLGSTPIGAPLIGWISESAGPRSGLVIGGVAALATAALAALAYRRAAGARSGAPAAIPSSSSPPRRLAARRDSHRGAASPQRGAADRHGAGVA
jgi:MFS family permease